jgi:XTP/dITP diphosphohydrolase
VDLLVATRNRHKLAEIRAILGLPGVRLLDLGQFPGLFPVREDGRTFRANAVRKARALAAQTGLWALADDSGLEVRALDGAPGVRSARFAGEPCDDVANNRKLIGLLRGLSDRRARFRCALALSDPHGEVRTVEGRCDGRVLRRTRGRHGFGYDPLFVPNGFTRTFAELAPGVKNRVSHRGMALRRGAREWGHILSSDARRWSDVRG